MTRHVPPPLIQPQEVLHGQVFGRHAITGPPLWGEDFEPATGLPGVRDTGPREWPRPALPDSRVGALGGEEPAFELPAEINLVSALLAYRDSPEREKRDRAPGLHVSDLASTEGHACDRVAYFSLVDAPRIGWSRSAFLEDALDVGHVIHEMLYPRLRKALAEFYPDIPMVCVSEVTLEGHPLGLIGTPDLLILLYHPYTGEFLRVVLIDVKSTSEKQMVARTKKGKIQVEAEYQRQISLYGGMIEDLHGHSPQQRGVLYAIKNEWPKPIEYRYTEVRGLGRYYHSVQLRLNRIIREHVDTSTPPSPCRGSHCAKCPFYVHCEETP